MSKYATLIAQIAANIRRNGAQAITGDLLQEQLLAMITSLGEYYQFGGLASSSAEFTPGDEPVVFVAATPGTYTNFGGLVVADNEVALLVWDGSAWSKQTTDIATRAEVSQLGQKYGDNEPQRYKDKYVYVILDDNGRLPFGIRKNGKVYIPVIENPDVDYAKHISEFVQKYCGEDKQYGWVEVKVDEQQRIVEGISTDGIKYINIPTEICNNTFKNINDENWVELNLDANGKLISGIRKNGSTYIAKLETGKENVIPACSDYAVWGPAETTDAFKTPNDRQLVTCSISYQELLDTYYNIYLHKDNQEYRVVRTELGYDSSGNHMIYEYDFIPQNYNRVVMLSAGMNTCELSGIFGLIYLIKNIMENHGTSGSGADVSGGLAYLYKNVRLKVIPVICPGSFDKPILAYLSYNGVNINRNFNFDDNWDGLSSTIGNWDYKGVSPESEVETNILKKWMRDNAHMSELWIDCHTDVGNNTQELFYTPLSDDKLKDIILAEQQKIKEYYTTKGFSPTNPSAYVVTPDSQYGKTRQMFYNFGVPTMMIEQFEGYTGIGGTGMNCEDVDIRNYVLMLRSYILAVLKSNREKLFLNLPNINLQSYIENVNKVFKF